MNGGDDDVMTLSEEKVLLLSDGKEKKASVVAGPGQKNCGRPKTLGPSLSPMQLQRRKIELRMASLVPSIHS